MSSESNSSQLRTSFGRQILSLGEDTAGVYLPVPWGWIVQSFREGDDLVLLLSNGRVLIIESFFAAADGREIVLLARSPDGGVDLLGVSSDGRAIELREVSVAGLEEAFASLERRSPEQMRRDQKAEEPSDVEGFTLLETGIGLGLLVAGGAAAGGGGKDGEGGEGSPREPAREQPLSPEAQAEAKLAGLEAREVVPGVSAANRGSMQKVLEAFAGHPSTPLKDMTDADIKSIIDTVNQHLNSGDEIIEARSGSLVLKIDRRYSNNEIDGSPDGTVDAEVAIEFESGSLRQREARYDETPEWNGDTDARNSPDWVETYTYDGSGQLIETSIDGGAGKPVDGRVDRVELYGYGQSQRVLEEVRIYEYRDVDGTVLRDSLAVDRDPSNPQSMERVERYVYDDEGSLVETRIDGGAGKPIDGRIDRIEIDANGDGLPDMAREYTYRTVGGRIVLDTVSEDDDPSTPAMDRVDRYSYVPGSAGQVYRIEHDINGNGTADGTTTYEYSAAGEVTILVDRDGDGSIEIQRRQVGGGSMVLNPDSGLYEIESGTLEYEVGATGTSNQLEYRGGAGQRVALDTVEAARELAGIDTVVLGGAGVGGRTLVLTGEGMNALADADGDGLPDDRNGDGTRDVYRLVIEGDAGDSVVLEGPGLEATDGIDSSGRLEYEWIRDDLGTDASGFVYIASGIAVNDLYIDELEEAREQARRIFERLRANPDTATVNDFAEAGIAGVTGANIDSVRTVIGAYEFATPSRSELTQEQFQTLVDTVLSQVESGAVVTAARWSPGAEYDDDGDGVSERATGRLVLSVSDRDGATVILRTIAIEQNAETLRAERITSLVDSDGDGTPDEAEISEFASDGKLIASIDRDFDIDGTPDAREEYSYDSQGRLTETRYDVSYDGTAANFEADGIETNTYGTGDNPLQTVFDFDADGTGDRIERYSYNAEDLVSRTEFDTDADGSVDRTETYRYDANDRLIYWSDDEDADGTADYIAYYGYDEAGRRVRWTIDGDGDGTTDRIYADRYDEDHLVESTLDSDADGTPDSVASFGYDVHGRRIRVSLDSDGDGTSDGRIASKYDEAGRLVERAYDHEDDGTFDTVFTFRFDEEGRDAGTSYDDDADGTAEISSTAYYSQEGRLSAREYDDDGDGITDRILMYDHDSRGRQFRTALDNDADGTTDAVEYNLYNARGRLRATEFDDNYDSTVDRDEYYFYYSSGLLSATGFDDDFDGTFDRAEYYYYRDVLNRRTMTEYDDDLDSTDDRVEYYVPDLLGRPQETRVDENDDGNDNLHQRFVYGSRSEVLETRVSIYQSNGIDEEAAQSFVNAAFRAEIDINGDSTPETFEVINPRGNIAVVDGAIMVDLLARVKHSSGGAFLANEAPEYSNVDTGDLESVVRVDNGTTDKVYPIIDAIEVDGTNYALHYDFERVSGLVSTQPHRRQHLDINGDGSADTGYSISNGAVEVLGEMYVPFNAIDYEGTVVRISEYSGDLAIESGVLTFVDGTVTAADVDGAVVEVVDGTIESVDADSIPEWIETFTYSGSELASRGIDYNADGTSERTTSYTRNSTGDVVTASYDFNGDGTAERSESHYLEDGHVAAAVDGTSRGFMESVEGGIPAMGIDVGEMGAILRHGYPAVSRASRVDYDDNSDGTADRIEHLQHDGAGHLVEIRMDLNADGTVDRTETYEYGVSHQVSRTQFRLGDSTSGDVYLDQSYRYDRFGRLSEMANDSNGDGTAEEIRSFEYDGFGRVQFQRLQSGLEIMQTPDGQGGFQRVASYSVDTVQEYQYNEFDQIVKSQDPGGDPNIFTVYDWDDEGRLIAESVELGNVAVPFPLPPGLGNVQYEIVNRYEYDDAGRVARRKVFTADFFTGQLSSDPNLVEEFVYDDFGRLQKIVAEHGEMDGDQWRRVTTNFFDNKETFAFSLSEANKVAYRDNQADVFVDIFSDSDNDGSPDDFLMYDRTVMMMVDGTDGTPDPRPDGTLDDFYQADGSVGADGTLDPGFDGTPDRSIDGAPERLIFEHAGDLRVSSELFDLADIAGIDEIHFANGPFMQRRGTTLEIEDDFLNGVADQIVGIGDLSIKVIGHSALAGTADDTLHFDGTGFQLQRYAQDGYIVYSDNDGHRLLVDGESVVVSTPLTRLVTDLLASDSVDTLTVQQLVDAGIDGATTTTASNVAKVISAFDESGVDLSDTHLQSILKYSILHALPQYIKESWAVTAAYFVPVTEIGDTAENVLVLDVNEDGNPDGRPARSVRVTFGEQDGIPLPEKADFDLDFVGAHYDLLRLADLVTPPSGFSNNLVTPYDLTEIYSYGTGQIVSSELKAFDGTTVGRLVDALDEDGETGSDGVAEELALEDNLALDQNMAWKLAGIASIDMDRTIPARPALPELIPGQSELKIQTVTDTNGDGTADYLQLYGGYELSGTADEDLDGDGNTEEVATLVWRGPHLPAAPERGETTGNSRSLSLDDRALSVLADGDGDGTADSDFKLLIKGDSSDQVVLRDFVRTSGLDEDVFHEDGRELRAYHAYQGTNGMVLVDSEISVSIPEAPDPSPGTVRFEEVDTDSNGTPDQLVRRTHSWSGQIILEQFDNDYNGTYDEDAFDADIIKRYRYAAPQQILYSQIDNDGDGTWDQIEFTDSLVHPDRGPIEREYRSVILTEGGAEDFHGIDVIDLKEGGMNKIGLVMSSAASQSIAPSGHTVYIVGDSDDHVRLKYFAFDTTPSAVGTEEAPAGSPFAGTNFYVFEGRWGGEIWVEAEIGRPENEEPVTIPSKRNPIFESYPEGYRPLSATEFLTGNVVDLLDGVENRVQLVMTADEIRELTTEGGTGRTVYVVGDWRDSFWFDYDAFGFSAETTAETAPVGTTIGGTSYAGEMFFVLRGDWGGELWIEAGASGIGRPEDGVPQADDPLPPIAIWADSDSDGTNDYVSRDYSDTDGDSQFDRIRDDTDGDGLFDVVRYDRNQDGISSDLYHFGLQSVIVAYFEHVETDEDFDGTFDLVEIDEDGDGNHERVEKSDDDDGTFNRVEFDGNDNGSIDRVEVDVSKDGTVDRIEHYVGTLSSASIVEEDTDNNGEFDRVTTDGSFDGFFRVDLIDEDGDGETDAVHVLKDTNSDGTLNHVETDVDGNGAFDRIRRQRDTNSNGTHDRVEVDYDNNGTFDYIEIDTDHDGVFNRVERDTDDDGTPNRVEVDLNNDGTINRIEIDADDTGADDGTANTIEIDTDGDGIVNRRELDTNNDGTREYIALDLDDDGRIDRIEIDSDGDGTADSANNFGYDAAGRVAFQELDDQADGTLDSVMFENRNLLTYQLNAEKAAEWQGIDGIALSQGGKTNFILSLEAFVALNAGTTGFYIDGDSDSDPVRLENPLSPDDPYTRILYDRSDVVRITLGDGNDGFERQASQEGGRDVYHYTVNGQDWKLLIDPDITVMDW